MQIQNEIETILNYFISKYNYIAFFSNSEDISSEDAIGSKRELFRIPITFSISNNKLVANYDISTSQYCPSSTISTASSGTEITLLSTAGFAVNDIVQVKIAGNYQDRRITSIVSNTITLDRTLGIIPTSGVQVIIKCTQSAIIREGSSGANSGTLAWIFKEDFAKESGTTVPGTVQIPLKGA